MGVKCQILINKAREGVHRAGQSVKGVVKYEVEKETEYKEVVLSMLGKGQCAWSEKHGKNTTHYRGTEDYIVHHVNICNQRPDETVVLHGEYNYPFEFFLPEDIPRSYKDKIAYIKYYIQLKFEKSNFFSFNKEFTAEIPVYSYMNPSTAGPVIFGLDKTLFAMFVMSDQTINLKAEINKTCFVPGENALITMRLNNDTDVEIISVRADLYCYTVYTADTERTKSLCDKMKTCESFTSEIAEKSVFEHTFVVPTLPELYSIENAKVIKKDYRIRITVRLPVPHINATVEMPILIGEQKGTLDRCLELTEDADFGGAEPPSYWEAMCEEEKTSK